MNTGSVNESNLGEQSFFTGSPTFIDEKLDL